MITIDDIRGIVITHKILGLGRIVDFKNDFLYIQFSDQTKGFKLPLAFEGFYSQLESEEPIIKQLINEIKTKNSTCCLCGKVDVQIKKYKDQLLCPNCYTNSEECDQCGRKVLENSLSYKEAYMCNECFVQYYFKCDNCEGYFSNWEKSDSDIIPQGQIWCKDCIDVCYACDNEFPKKDLITFDYIYRLCPECIKSYVKKCRKCKKEFLAKEKTQKLCNDCNAQLSFVEFLSTLDLSDHLYVSLYYFDFVDSSTVELMSRLNGSCIDDPFDILFLMNYFDEKLVIVSEGSKLYNSKVQNEFFDTCTLTELKKSNLFYKLINEKLNVISTIKWSENEVIDVWDKPVWLRAKTYADMDYRKEWEGGELVYEGNNYGDTSDFYIIGKTRLIKNNK